MTIILDSAAVTAFAAEPRRLAAWMRSQRREDAWLAAIPSVVLVECLTGDAGRDARVNQFVKTCEILEVVPTAIARSAARLRSSARRGSAIDALLVAFARSGDIIVTADLKDIRPLAAHAENVAVERI